MTKITSDAFYNISEIEKALESSKQSSRNRVCSDAIEILKYINGKIAKKAHFSDTALPLSTYYVKLSLVAIKKELGLTLKQIKNANCKLSELGYMEALTPRKVDGEWLHIWKVGPNLHIPMTQFSMREANTQSELNKEFMRWVGFNWTLVLPEDTIEVVLTDEDILKLKEIWEDERLDRQAIIDAQMTDLLEIIG